MPSGLLAFHISNKYLDLAPVLASAGHDLHLKVYDEIDAPSWDEAALGKQESSWLVMARSESALWPLVHGLNLWDPSDYDPAVKAWTDDFSDVLGAFHPDE
jgi:hypothetical protein